MDSSDYQQQQALDPSAYQINAYNPSAAGYYAYSYPQYGSDVQQQYVYYNYPVQPQHQEVHQELKPPGVSGPSQQAQMYYYHQYYQHVAAVNVDHHGGVGTGVAGGLPAEQMIAQPSYGGISGIDGRPPHGGARGRFGRTPSGVRRSFRGRGRDRGRTPHLPPKNAPAHAHNQITAAPVLPPPKVAWCSLCKVDCNTREILETHRLGKKHLKNVKVHEELQNRNKSLIQEQMPQASSSEIGPEVPPWSNPILGYGEIKLHPVTLSDRPVDEEAGKRKVEDDVEPSVGPVKKPRMDRSAGRGRGLRNKIRGGKGGDRMMSHHETGILAEPRKPKEVIPLICELCNIKCDTAAVFQCHLMGKKHLSKAKSFLRQNEILGQEVLKALNPAILALLQNAANVSTSIGAQLHNQGFVPFQGTSGLDANGLHFYAPTSGINPESTEAEAMNQPLSFSTNSGSGTLVNTDGKSNEGLSESGAENANPAPVSLAVAQAERVAACTAFAISGAAISVGSVFEEGADVPSSDQNAHPGSYALAGLVQSKGEGSA